MINYTQSYFIQILLWKNTYTNESIHQLKNSDEYGNCVDLKNHQNYSSYIKMKQILEINMKLSHLKLQVKYDI